MSMDTKEQPVKVVACKAQTLAQMFPLPPFSSAPEAV